MTTPAPAPRRAPGLADLPAAALMLLLGGAHWSVTEDAYITFRYAWNWVHGHGVRFNAGPGDPVEGFSNFLWLVVGAIFEGLGLSPETFVPAVSLMCGVVLVWQVRVVAERHLGASRPAAVGAAVATACFAPAVHWATSGLEPMPQTLLMFLAATGLAFEDRPSRGWWVGLACLALALIRTEGIAWVPVMMVLAALLRRHEARDIAPVLGRAGLVLALGYAAFLAWKVPYYGSWVSNVAAAKVGFGAIIFWRGLSYVATFGLVLLWPLVVPLGWWHGARRQPARVLWLALLTAAVPAWAVLIGGDYMGYFRFLVPATPFLGLGLALTLDALAHRLGPRALPAGAVVASLLGAAPLVDVILLPQSLLRPLDYSTPVAADGKGEVVFRRGKFLVPGTVRFLEVEAEALTRFVKPGETMVAAAIGLNGYRNPEVRFLDLCGLTEPRVAVRDVTITDEMRPGHEKCVGPRFFLADKPDVLVFATSYGRATPDEMRAKTKAWRRKFPADRYAPDLVVMRAPVPGGWFFGYGLRRVPPKAQAEALWKRFDDLIDEIDRRAQDPQSATFDDLVGGR